MDVHAGINKNIDDFNYHQHREVKVPGRTLNSLLTEVGADHVDLLSIDVEGAETMVVSGGSKVIDFVRPVFYIEVSLTTVAAAPPKTSPQR